MKAGKSFCPQDLGVSEKIIGTKWRSFFIETQKDFFVQKRDL